VSDLSGIELVSVYKYTLKEDMDIKKDKWLQFPLSSGIAVYAYDYTEKHMNKLKKKRKVN